MGIKYRMDNEGNLTRHMEPDEIITAGKDAELFPLFTKKDMADRWGESIQVIGNWAKRHTDFPKPVTGILAGDPAAGKGGGAVAGGLYPAYEVYRYEKTRGLAK